MKQAGGTAGLAPLLKKLRAVHAVAGSSVVEEVGHMSPMERPGAVAQALLEWLDLLAL